MPEIREPGEKGGKEYKGGGSGGKRIRKKEKKEHCKLLLLYTNVDYATTCKSLPRIRHIHFKPHTFYTLY